VEGDASSASYFLAAGLLGGGPLRVEAWDARPAGDVRFTDVIEAMEAGRLRRQLDRGVGRPPLVALDADLNTIPTPR